MQFALLDALYDVHVFFSKLTEMFFTSDSEAVGYLRKSAIILSRA